MIHQQRVAVVLPAYNAARTLERTCRAIPTGVVDDLILVDDASQDTTVAVAQQLGLRGYRHAVNRGYGASQKTGYQAALDRGADIVVMLHPDNQYPAELVPALASAVASGVYHIVLGSRLLGTGAIQRGMPRYKHLCNRLWTWGQNLALRQHLSEYHTGFRAFSRSFLLRVPLLENSDDFLFDNQLLVQAIAFGYAIGEFSAPARFTEESSSISPWRGIRYGVGILGVTGQYLLDRAGLLHARLFDPVGRRLSDTRIPAEPLAPEPIPALDAGDISRP